MISIELINTMRLDREASLCDIKHDMIHLLNPDMKNGKKIAELQARLGTIISAIDKDFKLLEQEISDYHKEKERAEKLRKIAMLESQLEKLRKEVL